MKTWHTMWHWQVILLLVAASAMQPALRAQGLHPDIFNVPLSAPPVPSPQVFPIIAWGGSPSDPDQLRMMSEAGFNVSGFCLVKDIGLVHAAGLACFVDDVKANGYNWKQLPPDDQIRQNAAALKAQLGSNPAALGFYLSDEPNASIMPAIGHVAALLRAAMPEKLPYVNLYPHFVPPQLHGASSYEAYVRMLVDVIHQPFLSYDNYSLVDGGMRDQFYTNLEIVRRISLETKTPFWNIVLANAHFNYMEPSDATLSLQVFSTLAYGGGGIQYFTYLTYPGSNFRLAAIDPFGNKTATWDMLRRINLKLHVLAPTMAQLRSTGVYHFPDVPEQGHPLSESRLVKSVQMTQQEIVRAQARGSCLVGEFEDDQGRPYLMVVNKSLVESFDFRIHLKQEGKQLACINAYTGREGGPADWLAPGDGFLCRVF